MRINHFGEAKAHTLFGRGVDSPRQFGVRLSRFGRDDNIGSILGSFQGNCLANAPRSAGNEDCPPS